ncbi:hypothetical protein [Enemella evansiae]|uniref:hypothetical protein n=1 Tax=Enemella evansiae TaxID=2016499 RepID=UPI0011810A30|nr:hypothetical protein [Enemella evansiae]
MKVDVCPSCNNGWMSRLENRVKHLLDPLIRGHASWVKLSTDDLQTLATWVSKTFMAYLTIREDFKNPFNPQDYRSISSVNSPPPGCQIWMLRSHNPRAQVGLSINSTYISTTADASELISERDNLCMGYLAIPCVAFVIVVVRADLPNELVDALIPEQLKADGVRRIWPDPRAQYFPLQELPDWKFEGLLQSIAEIQSWGLPSIGLNAGELREVRERFLAGEDPKSIRAKWGC